MADPIKSVDISRLQECNPDLMEGLRRPQLEEKLKEVLQGSDLQWDEKSKEIVASDKANKVRDITQQAQIVREYITAANGDNEFTLEEAKAYIAKHEEFSSFTPEAFLADAKEFIEKRWGVVCTNLKQYSVEFPLENLLGNLKVYNDGFYKEEFEQGRMSASILKTPANVSWFFNFPVYGLLPFKNAPIKVFDLEFGTEKKIEATYLGGDNMSMRDAYDDHVEREGAIIYLQEILNKDLKENGTNGAAWNSFRKSVDPGQEKTSAEKILQLLASSGPLTVKVERKDGSADVEPAPTITYEVAMTGPRAAEILRDQLAFADLFDMLMTADKDKRHEKAITFAQGERAGLLGFGGGHGKHRDWDNVLTSEVNNFYYAKSLLATVIREGGPVQRKKASDLLFREMAPAVEGPNGSENGGGSLSYLPIWAVSNLFCGAVNTIFRTHLQGAPYKAMSDEEAMYAPERVLRAGLVMWGGPKLLGLGGKVGPKLESWRAADRAYKAYQEQKVAAAAGTALAAESAPMGINVFQRGILGGAWVADKAGAVLTARPVWKGLWKWWSKGEETSERANQAKRAWDVVGKLVVGSMAAYKIDEYSTPISTDRHYPNLQTNRIAREMTLDPLPPDSYLPKGPERK